MYLAVLSFFSANPALQAAMAVLVGLLTTLNNKVAAISSINEILLADSRGVALDKQALRRQLIESTYGLAGALSAYFEGLNDLTNAKAFNYTESALKRLADTELADVARAIYTAANANLVGLADYGVSAAELLTYQTLITAYNSSVPAPRLKTSEKKALRANQQQLFKECTALLNDRFDKTMRSLKKDDPEKYAEYRNVRIIVNIGVRHEEPPVTPPVP